MAQRPRRLKLRFSEQAKARLAEIWRWNATQYGEQYATEFLDFLQARTSQLELLYQLGRPVPSPSKYQYMLIKKRSSGHGHVVIYEVSQLEVLILEYFHTAQDWQNLISEL
jgi:plasmid stabilization system protein ParE